MPPMGETYGQRPNLMAKGLLQHSQGQRPWNPNASHTVWPTAIVKNQFDNDTMPSLLDQFY